MHRVADAQGPQFQGRLTPRRTVDSYTLPIGQLRRAIPHKSRAGVYYGKNAEATTAAMLSRRSPD